MQKSKSSKCPKCGLVNLTSDVNCRRCKFDLANYDDRYTFSAQPSAFQKDPKWICKECGTLGQKMPSYPGSVAVEGLLLLLSVGLCAFNWIVGSIVFVAFVIYCIFRLSNKKHVCFRCGSSIMVPIDSPAGSLLVQQFHPQS